MLYVFATSSVRGFAFFLGLSTAMDLLLAYCFMHPMVSVLARRPALVQLPGVGIAAGARRAGSDGMTATTHRAAPAEDIPGVTRRHRPSDFYHERTNFQFIKHTRRWAILSGTLLLLSFVAVVHPRPQLRHRLRGRHLVAGADGARPAPRTSPTSATCCGRSGSPTRR